MGRIVLTTLGSTGDMNPFLALGLGLRERGHEVQFALEEYLRPAAEGLEFPVHRLSGDALAALGDRAHVVFGSRSPVTSTRIILERWVLPSLPAKVDEMRSACAGADLVVASVLQFAGSVAAEALGIPRVSLALSPASVPSGYYPPVPFGIVLPGPVQRVANRFLWSIGALALRRSVDPPVNAVRVAAGLPRGRDFLFGGTLSRALTAVAVSPAFIPPPPDWSPWVRAMGFLYWDTPVDWQEPAELAAFLDGPAPVVSITSGSMA